jgi:hypothetical protein
MLSHPLPVVKTENGELPSHFSQMTSSALDFSIRKEIFIERRIFVLHITAVSQKHSRKNIVLLAGLL